MPKGGQRVTACKGSLNRNQPCVESRCEPGRCLFCGMGMPDPHPTTPLLGQCLDAEGDRRHRCEPVPTLSPNERRAHPSDLRRMRFRR